MGAELIFSSTISPSKLTIYIVFLTLSPALLEISYSLTKFLFVLVYKFDSYFPVSRVLCLNCQKNCSSFDRNVYLQINHIHHRDYVKILKQYIYLILKSVWSFQKSLVMKANRKIIIWSCYIYIYDQESKKVKIVSKQ